MTYIHMFIPLLPITAVTVRSQKIAIPPETTPVYPAYVLISSAVLEIIHEFPAPHCSRGELDSKLHEPGIQLKYTPGL